MEEKHTIRVCTFNGVILTAELYARQQDCIIQVNIPLDQVLSIKETKALIGLLQSAIRVCEDAKTRT